MAVRTDSIKQAASCRFHGADLPADEFEAEVLEWEERGIWYTPPDADLDVEGIFLRMMLLDGVASCPKTPPPQCLDVLFTCLLQTEQPNRVAMRCRNRASA